MTPRLARRRFLQALGATAALTACGGGSVGGQGDGAAGGPTSGDGPDPSEVRSFPVALFSTDRVIAAGTPQRIPFAVFTPDRVPRRDDALPARLRVRIAQGETEVAVETVELHGRSDVPFPYYPLRAELAEAGLYELTAELDDGPGRLAVQAFDLAEVQVPQVGQPLPSTPTPTMADPRGVDPVCTRFEPCPLHDRSLDTVLGSAPVALLVGTPAYCQTGVCGPTLDQLVAAADAHPEVVMIHAEVYQNPAEVDGNLADPALRVAPVTQALHLAYEPVLFVADAAGVVVDRLDNVYDAAELDAALRLVS
jgi:hypothetical protein